MTAPHTSSRREPLPGALAPALYSWCPFCGDVRPFSQYTEYAPSHHKCGGCGAIYCTCVQCYRLLPLSEIGAPLSPAGAERLLAALNDPEVAL